MKKLLILAGGFGSRLKTAVSNVPKPLAPVLGKPFLEYLIKHYISQGVDDFVFLLHYDYEKILSLLSQMKKDGYLDGIKVKSVVEMKPLGTGGSILNAVEELNLNTPFLATNADTWLGSGILDMDVKDGNSLLAVKVKNSSRYGTLVTEGDHIVKFQEKSDSIGPGWISAGLYQLDPKIFKSLSGTKTFSLEKLIFPKLVSKASLRVVKLNTDFIDIGVPEDYFRFCRWIEKDKTGEL